MQCDILLQIWSTIEYYLSLTCSTDSGPLHVVLVVGRGGGGQPPRLVFVTVSRRTTDRYMTVNWWRGRLWPVYVRLRSRLYLSPCRPLRLSAGLLASVCLPACLPFCLPVSLLACGRVCVSYGSVRCVRLWGFGVCVFVCVHIMPSVCPVVFAWCSRDSAAAQRIRPSGPSVKHPEINGSIDFAALSGKLCSSPTSLVILVAVRHCVLPSYGV